MAVTQARGSNQIMDTSIPLSKLITDFLAGSDWNITNGNNNAVITGLGTPVNGNDAVNKIYVDALYDGSLKAPEAYDPTVTSNYPLTYGGASIQAGDSFRITASGTMGTRTVNTEDLLIALVDGAGAAIDTDWMVAESNRDQATETILGVARLATSAEALAGINDTAIMTPSLVAEAINNVPASNGIVNDAGTIQLGGNLTENTAVGGTGGGDGYNFTITTGALGGGAERSKLSLLSTNGASIFAEHQTNGNVAELKLLTTSASLYRENWMSGEKEEIVMNTNGIMLSSGTNKPAFYLGDYSANYVNRSIPDVEWVNNQITNVTEAPIHRNESLAVTNGSAVLPAVANLGTSGIQWIELYLNGALQEPGIGNDYTVNLVTGVPTMENNLSTGDKIIVRYQENNS